MVFFTCNACGSSLKKNQVEKHYQNECPRCEVLSCMDCGRDFHGDEYVAHTKCVSEAEKYQGSLFRESGKGGGAGKGEKKQQEWIERVQVLVADGTKVNPKISRLLERIAQYPNIPRKKAKFENFVWNSINLKDQKTLDELWQLFSTAIKPVAAVNSYKSTSNELQTSTQNEEEVADKDKTETLEVKEITETSTEDVAAKKEKKRKKKTKAEEESSAVETHTTEVAVLPTETKSKKKKKRKEKELSDNNEALEEEEEEVKSEEYNTTDMMAAEIMSEEESSLPVKLKKRKKCKTKENIISPIDDVQQHEQNGGDRPKKKKKKRQSLEKESVKEENEDCKGVDPTEIAVEYINGYHQNHSQITDGNPEAGEHENKTKKSKKKRMRSRETTSEEIPVADDVIPHPPKKKQKKSKHKQ